MNALKLRDRAGNGRLPPCATYGKTPPSIPARVGIPAVFTPLADTNYALIRSLCTQESAMPAILLWTTSLNAVKRHDNDCGNRLPATLVDANRALNE
jgi:hypothetical protein